MGMSRQEITQRRERVKSLEDSILGLQAKHSEEVQRLSGLIREERAAIEALERSAAAEKAVRSMAITINADGVFVGGHKMTGCLRWDILREPASGLTEVALVLATDKLTVDLTAPPNRIL